MEKSPSRWWDLPSAALFLFAILVSVWRLTATDWTDNLGYVINLAASAAILGLALGASRFQKRGVRWLALGYTLVFLPRQMLAYYDNDIYLGERLASAGGRLLYSISEFAANRPVEDAMFFIFLIGTLYWFLALFAGYQLTRHNNTLAAILPAGLTMLVIHQSDPGGSARAWIVAFYLLAALTLLARGKYLRDRAGWIRRGVHLAPETGPDLGMGALLGAAALVVLAWNMPLDLSRTPALEEKWRGVTRPWRGARDRLGRAFDALEGKGGVERNEFFRSSLSLGNSAAQGDELALIATVPLEALELPRLYWRAKVYDRYEGGAWRQSESAKGRFSPQAEELPIPDREARTVYEFTLRSYTQSQATLSLPGQPLWVSRPVDVTFVGLPDGAQDIFSLETYPFLEPGEAYRARSAIASPSLEELRAAGEDYPEWVKTRYLQLPEDFSDRVRGFASQITFGLNNPYEKAQAVTAVLRAQIDYQTKVPPAPEGTDPLEWFLFDVKQGYCNYYATAEVLLLRSVGVPARLAVGFAQGEIVEGAQRPGEIETGEQEFSVTRKQTHAWPEVYFPGIGWVEFEPTTNQDPLVRPETRQADPAPAAPPQAESTPGPNLPIAPAVGTPNPGGQAAPLSWLSFLAWALFAAACAAGLFFADQRFALSTRAAQYVLTVTDRRGDRGPSWIRNLALFTLANPFERAFHPVNQTLRRMGNPPAAHLTPSERGAALSALLPEAASDIEILLREYQSAQYAPRGGDLALARRASWNIFRRGWRAFLAARSAQLGERW